MDTSRNEILIGAIDQKKISNKNVCIVGVGGVGGYVAHMLARAGVGKITIIDFDKVSSSNINRQLVASVDTIGKSKVEVLKKQLENINTEIIVKAIDQKLTKENILSLICEKYDIVVDAIDSVEDKVALIVFCKKNGVQIISAMGAGNRYMIPRFYLTDIYKTHDDGLAKIVRKKLREEGVDSLDVVTCEDKAVKTGEKTIGSISYFPAMCGITISAVIINKFLEGEL